MREDRERHRPDGYELRRWTMDAGISLVTDLELATVVEAMRAKKPENLEMVAWATTSAATPCRSGDLLAGAPFFVVRCEHQLANGPYLTRN